MKRSDRRNGSYDNSINNPRPRSPEPPSIHDLTSRLQTVRAQKTELEARVQVVEKQAADNHQLYLKEQGNYQSTLILYQEAQSEAQSYLTLYNEEQVKSQEWLTKYQAAESQTQHYLTLYNQTLGELKFERRSKAGIKGWETRRKKENERLKQEIAEMTILLRDSLVRKEEAIGNLEALADRMDRIQNLVDSVGEESANNPVNLLQKFQRIWWAIKDILAE